MRPVLANKRVLFGYGLNYLIDTKHAVIVDSNGHLTLRLDEVDMGSLAVLHGLLWLLQIIPIAAIVVISLRPATLTAGRPERYPVIFTL